MATINLDGKGRSGGRGSIAVLLAPEFLSGDGYSESWGSASLSPIKSQRNLSGTSVSSGTATVRRTMVLFGQGLSESFGQATGFQIVGELVEFDDGEGYSESDGLAQPGYLIELQLEGISVGEGVVTHIKFNPLVIIGGSGLSSGRGEGEWQFLMPLLRDPEQNEIRGAINLVRNPSLENIDRGLTDWAVINATHAISDLAAREGERSDLVQFTLGQTNSSVAVRSQASLMTVGKIYIGSVHLSGLATLIHTRLKATYTDGTTQEEVGTVDEVLSIDTAEDEWVRVFSPVLVADGGKILNYLQVYVWQDTALDELVYVDAAMIEDITLSGSPSEYVDGDMPGGSWTGIPGYSVSFRDPVVIE